MPPIVIPRLQKFQKTSDQPKNDRLNVRVQDQSAIFQKNANAIAGVAQQGIDVYTEIENNKIDQLSKEAEQEYTIWNNQKLTELRSYQGDPTDAFADFEDEEEKKFEEIMSKREDLNERVKSHVRSNLAGVQGQTRIGVLKQRGLQQESYEHNLFESSVKLKKNNLPISAGYITKDDNSSFLPFDKSVSDIKTLIIKRGLKNGTVKELDPNAKSWGHIYTDPDGVVHKVSLSNITKGRIAKELSDGVSNSIKVLLDTGYPEEAKLLQDRYKGSIDPLNAAKLAKKFKSNDVKGAAYNIIQGMRGKTPTEQLAEINKIKNEEIRSEVLKIKDSNDGHIQHIRDRKDKANYETLANRVIEKMNSQSPYFGAADLENDPVYKQTWDNISPKRKQNILEMVEAPKDSAAGSQTKIQNLFFGDDEKFEIETITPTEFAMYTSGLSKADKKKYTSRYNKLRVESAGAQRSMYKRAESFLTDQLVLTDYIKKNEYGKFDKKYEKKLIEARNELIDHLDSQEGVFSDKQLKDFVIQYSAQKTQDEIFIPPPRRVFNEKKKSTQVNPEVELTDDQKLKARVEFKNTYSRFPTADDLKSVEFFNIVKELR